MKDFIMLCGAPCSGKTTAAHPYIELGYAYISSDQYIEDYAKSVGKTYSDVFDEQIKPATKKMYETLTRAIETGLDIIWDQTNLSRKSRMEKLAKIPSDYIKNCIYLDVAYGILIDRNEKRYNETGKMIPYNILHRMAVQAEVPTNDEGWDLVQIRIKTE